MELQVNHFSYCTSCAYVFHTGEPSCPKCKSTASAPVTQLLENNLGNTKVAGYLKRVQEGRVTLQGVRKFVSQNKLATPLANSEACEPVCCGCN
jgi:hypothetical protein